MHEYAAEKRYASEYAYSHTVSFDAARDCRYSGLVSYLSSPTERFDTVDLGTENLVQQLNTSCEAEACPGGGETLPASS